MHRGYGGKQLRNSIKELAIEAQRRRSPLTGKIGEHLSSFGLRQDFFNLLKSPKLASLPIADREKLQLIARRLDSVSKKQPSLWQNRVKTALAKALSEFEK